MKRVIFVFVRNDDHEEAASGSFLSRAGTSRMLRLKSLLSQVGLVNFGPTVVCAEQMNYSDLNAKFFSELCHLEADPELHCGECGAINTTLNHLASTNDTIVLFDTVGSRPLFTEYKKLVNKHALKIPEISIERYRSGKVLALVLDIERRQMFKILLGEEVSSAA